VNFEMHNPTLTGKGRNEEYLKNAGAFSNDIAISAALIRLIPNILKPLLAWIILLPNRWHLYKASKFLLPLIQQRMKELQESQTADRTKEDLNDFTTWSLEEAAKNSDPQERTPDKIVKRLMTVNFASIHTTTFTATNMLFDLISSYNATENIQELREEIQEVLSQHNGKWDKDAISKLIKVDSAIRESLRISTFMSHGMDRMVVSPGGVKMQDGLHLPQGTRVGTCTYSIHRDGDIYDDPENYDPFRFSRIRENPKTHVNIESQKDLTKVLEAKNLSMVTTSDTFLAFGHGRHGCPGRFFAAMNMKLLLAYIILNYDIEPLESRPSNGAMGGSILPPMRATISVKRRLP
jgi:cytochrome P450